MKMTKWAMLTLVAAVTMVSCEKEKSAQTCERNMAGIAGRYKLAALEYKLTATATPVDYLALMDACQKDDIIELKTAGTYTYTDAGVVCSPAGSDNGTWSISGNVLTSDGLVTGNIESFDCKTLVVYTDNVNVPGDRFTQTLVKQ